MALFLTIAIKNLIPRGLKQLSTKNYLLSWYKQQFDYYNDSTLHGREYPPVLADSRRNANLPAIKHGGIIRQPWFPLGDCSPTDFRSVRGDSGPELTFGH